MKYIVIVYHPEEGTWYAPVVDAPSRKAALRTAQDVYWDCDPVCALGKEDLEHMLQVLRESLSDF